jgi:RNA recognition motif-containing protein
MSAINIYVGNLSFDANEDQLRELFEGYGKVDSAKIISDQFTGRSRGFGFVEMAEKEEGMRAIEELNAKDFLGRSLKVNEARPKRDAGGRDSRPARW